MRVGGDQAELVAWEQVGVEIAQSGTVEFRAMYRAGRHTGEQRENSKFVKQDGLWFYVGPVGA